MVWILLATMLAACGGRQQSQSGVEPDTVLHLYGADLVGAEVAVAGKVVLVSESDLVPYPIPVGGAKDVEKERLQHVVIRLNPGTHHLVIRRDSGVLVDRQLYFSNGQTRELRVQP